MQPDPTSPLDLDAIRERYERTQAPMASMTLSVIHNAKSAADVPALLTALAEAQRTVQELLRSRDAWQRKHEKTLADAGTLLAERERMRPVVEAAKAWRVAELPPDAHNKVYRALNALAIAVDAFEHPEDAAVDTYETQEGTDCG